MYYKGDENLRAAGQSVELTELQIAEYAKCMEDYEYFIENYVKILDVDTKQMVLFKLRPYQKRLLDAIHNNRWVVARMSRQCGKCQHINTIVTVRNKKTGTIENITMGELYARAKK